MYTRSSIEVLSFDAEIIERHKSLMRKTISIAGEAYLTGNKFNAAILFDSQK